MPQSPAKFVRARAHRHALASLLCVPAIPVTATAVVAPAVAPKNSQEAVVAPNENLVVEGVPPIPASLAEKADRYTNFRSATFTSWHPQRREMLVSTRFGDTFQIHRVAAPGAERYQL